jgi:hypothetical protein
MGQPIRRVLYLRSVAGCGGGSHPSTNAVADALQRPTRALGRAALKHALSGLAPGGVYLAPLVTQGTGGLLHRRFTLTRTPKGRAVCFLWHCPAGCPEWALPTTLLSGARTFLGPLSWHATAWLSHPPQVYRQPTAGRRRRAGRQRQQAARGPAANDRSRPRSSPRPPGRSAGALPPSLQRHG